MKRKIIGTGKFTYREECLVCGKKNTLVDINGECRKCYNADTHERYQENLEKQIKRMAGI
jgi:hypothetical protein